MKALPILAAGLIAGACSAQAQTLTVETFAGPVELAAVPETIAVLDVAAIDSIDALGVPVAGVPDIQPPAYLEETFATAQTIGTVFEPDFEALAVMAPDLIVAGGRSQPQVEPLSGVAPTLDMSIRGDILETGRERLESYGALFGREAEAEALLADLDAALDAARTAVEGKGGALILMTNGGKLSAYGDESRFGWLHTALNLPEAYPDLDADTHGESVSFEFIAETDPEIILVIDRGAAIGQDGEAAAATLDNPLVAGTRAGESGQIVYLDSAPLYLAGGGIRSLLGSIGEVTAALQDGDS